MRFQPMPATINLFLFFAFLVPLTVSAGFNFGDLTKDGTGQFSQKINEKQFVDVGTIPKGVKDLSVRLTSDKDVDIQVWDTDNNIPVVGWQVNAKIGDSFNGTFETTSYNGVTVKYSGYNGDGTGAGHEYISLEGVAQNRFLIKAYGYVAGVANVNYSWKGVSNVAASGTGNFQQQIVQKAIVDVGNIPVGIDNLSIQLTSDNDVDIQLYDADGGTAIVAWPSGILKGEAKQSVSYQGMVIEWSGFNGGQTSTTLGNEYIKITGKTTRNLTMKAYGYQAGYATVNYSWGVTTTGTTPLKLPNGNIQGDAKGWVSWKSVGSYLDDYQGVTAYQNDLYMSSTYQCAELAARFIHDVYGVSKLNKALEDDVTLLQRKGKDFALAYDGTPAKLLFSGANTSLTLTYFPNGSAQPPVNGSFVSQYSPASVGHVWIVKKVEEGDADTLYVYAFEQNWIWSTGEKIAHSRKMTFKRSDGKWTGTDGTYSAIGWLVPMIK